ncbi:uncharacterized protein BX664DRAFT_345145 [Halteromyces radiatus]|uniref:uncharacterized protein n=1 Tax=Halteromyces radiatus TaxID=101107 RepID=UPI00221F6B50|nr:uncharacterized protein BX664DRAFT_345145 [Halteromyces radiatus]KAI8099040.1 hypothetical protein BX664DRAFT_345145 [Halteromyces radiatus]
MKLFLFFLTICITLFALVHADEDDDNETIMITVYETFTTTLHGKEAKPSSTIIPESEKLNKESTETVVYVTTLSTIVVDDETMTSTSSVKKAIPTSTSKPQSSGNKSLSIPSSSSLSLLDTFSFSPITLAPESSKSENPPKATATVSKPVMKAHTGKKGKETNVSMGCNLMPNLISSFGYLIFVLALLQ